MRRVVGFYKTVLGPVKYREETSKGLEEEEFQVQEGNRVQSREVLDRGDSRGRDDEGQMTRPRPVWLEERPRFVCFVRGQSPGNVYERETDLPTQGVQVNQVRERREFRDKFTTE